MSEVVDEFKCFVCELLQIITMNPEPSIVDESNN